LAKKRRRKKLKKKIPKFELDEEKNAKHEVDEEVLLLIS